MAAAGFLSRYMSGSLPYVSRHITVNTNVLSASLNTEHTSLPSLRQLTIKRIPVIRLLLSSSVFLALQTRRHLATVAITRERHT